MSKIYFAKKKQEAIIPSKRDEDAGYDFYAAGRDDEWIIEPGEIKIIPTGIATAFDSDKVLIIKERSSTGKIGLAVRMGVVDSGFRGEIGIGLNNTSDKVIIITYRVDQIREHKDEIYYPITKAIAQGVLLTLPKVEVTEVSYEELLEFKSERMLTKLGESGK